LIQGEHTRDEWIQILCKHIKTVVTHYRGEIYAWHVVNEALENNGILRDTLWLRTIGPEYIAMAYQWTHEADPGALLIYNDHSGEGLNRKSQAIYALARGLIEKGIPLHGIGFQMHVYLWGPPTSDALRENMRRFAALGLQVHITEMDVQIYFSPHNQVVNYAEQAYVYRQAFDTCLEASNCSVFMTWGLTDRHSWIPQFFGHPDAPLIFDEERQPKPAYYAIQDLLKTP
jgi:endo-1,4-beta-xylanase